jgi:hypothetical protein
MSREKNNGSGKNDWWCCWCDEIGKMMRGCVTDDAGYTDCLARMNNNLGRSCGQKVDRTGRKENRDCCG